MKKALLFFTLSITTLSIFAQQPDSLLKQFKYRIDHFRSISIFGGGSSQYKQQDLGAGNYKDHSSSGNAGGTYFQLISTDKILQTISTGVGGSYARSKAVNPTETNTNTGFFVSPHFSILNTRFAKKMFTELGADISGLTYNNKLVTSNYPFTEKNKQTQYSISLNTGIGKGRLENITDMQNALWLNAALTVTQRLTRNLSADDLNDLGKAITKGNNTRVLDSRKRTQFFLATVDNCLQQKGLISKTDIAYFSSLNDILFFAFNIPRLSGTQKFIRFTPSIAGNNGEQHQGNGINRSTNDFSARSLVLSSGIKKYKPVNLKHQNNYGASVKLNYTSTDLNNSFYTNNNLSSEIKGQIDLKQAGLNVFYDHAFYPNTRTIVDINLQTTFGYQDVSAKEDFFANANLSGNFNYFISYRTRLNCNVAAYWLRNTYYLDRAVELLPNGVQLSASAGVEISL